MKRIWILIMALTLSVLVMACQKPPAPAEPETQPIVTEPEPTKPPIVQTEPKPEHSALYIPGLSVEDVILYFNEVCLDSEFSNGGDPSLVQKWTAPIRFVLNGAYTEEDLQVLTAFAEQLNAIEGFPGIYQAQDSTEANLQIYFCQQQDMVAIMGSEDYYNLDGGVIFWYNGANEIYDATICYRTDLDQYTRNSVILEEIYNGLGPVQDTCLRPDSIAYQEFSTPQSITQIDELILKLLYHPDVQCGMDVWQCEQVIRALYY